ncbi:MAG: glycoside hydrolase family 2, partial [Acidobacteria bacterium]|nr:glycoside hydrolase family 2 [Acidobacteriota bacterium]
ATGLLLANARDTIARFRNHPSIAIWCGRNEGVPPSAINTGLEKLVREVDGTRFYIPNSRFVNLQRSGPWNYGEPVEFFTTRARGFSTELGVPSPPATEAIRAMMPQPDQWPPSDTWSYHDWHQGKGTGVQPFMAAITDHLGAPSGLEDFERKAQMLNYVTHRAMFEGFNANLFHPDSGRLMWMSHPAWPSMVWQLYGSDYDTFGSFYGVKKACEPLHVQLNLPDMAVAVVNTTAQPASNLTVLARLFSADGTLKQKWEGKVSAGPDSVVQALRLDATAADGFLKLELFDSNRNLVSENFYWPYSAAAGLAAAKVSAAAHLVRKGEDAIVVVELANTGKTVALMNRLMVRNAAGERILPAYADDNYINLLPGEKRTVHIACTAPASGALRLSLEGWNTPSAVVEIGKNGGSR